MASVAKARTVARLAGAASRASPRRRPQAQPPALPRRSIVVVDMTQIMRDAKAAKDVQAQVEKQQMNAYSKEVSQKEDELKNLRDELERQRTVLCARRLRRASRRSIQQRYVALDHDVQAKRQAMQQSYSEAMTKVENAALQIIADVAKERKANMVVAKAALALHGATALDITAEVTRRLDAKLPDAGREPAEGPAPTEAAAQGPRPGRDANEEVSDGRSALLHRRRAVHRSRARARAPARRSPARRERDRILSDVAPLDSAGPEHLTFLDNRKYLDALAPHRAPARAFVHPDLAGSGARRA